MVMRKLTISALLVAAFVILALLGMLGDPISLFGLVTLGALWWALIVAGLYLLAVGVVFRKASGGMRRYAKFAAIGLAVVFLFGAFVGPALTIAPDGDDVGAPTALLTIAEGTCFNFPDFSTDGNCATGNAEIAINSDDLIVALDVTGQAGANTLSPDSWAIDFTLRCTGNCDYERAGAAFQTPYHARLVGLSDWIIDGNTTTIDIFEKNTDGTMQIAWTDTGSNTIVGFEDGGAMNSFGDGESGTFTLSMYMNENGLPQGIPDGGEKYVRTLIINIFSPRGGTSFNVEVDFILTNNSN